MSIAISVTISAFLSLGKISSTEAIFKYLENEIVGLDDTIRAYKRCITYLQDPMHVAWCCGMWKTGVDNADTLKKSTRYQQIRECFFNEHQQSDPEVQEVLRLEKMWADKANFILSLEKDPFGDHGEEPIKGLGRL